MSVFAGLDKCQKNFVFKKANILFKDAKAAAKFINENYEKIDDWWFIKSTIS